MAVYSAYNNIQINESVLNEARYTPDLVGTYTIIAECQANYNKIMQAIGLAELRHLEESGVEIVYEAVSAKAIIDKVIAWFRSIPGKIMSALQKLVDKLQNNVATDAAFVKAYGKKLADLTGTLKGRPFNDLNPEYVSKSVNSLVGVLDANGIGDVITNGTSALDVDRDKVLQAMHNAINLPADYSAKGLVSTLTDIVVGEEQDLTVKGSELVDIIKSASKDIAAVKKSCNAVIKTVKEITSKLEKAKSKVDENAEDAIKKINTFADLNKTCMELAIACNGVFLAAIDSRRKQAKSHAMQLLKANKAAKKEEKKEEPTPQNASFIHTFEQYVGSFC